MKNSLSYRLIEYIMRDDPWGSVFALILSVMGGLVELAGVATVYPFLTLLNRPELIHSKPALNWLYHGWGCANDREFIFYFGVISIIMFMFVNAFMFAKQAYLTRFSLTRTARISIRLLKSYLYRPYEFFLDHNTGEISKNVISQADLVANSVLLSWMSAISEFFVLTSIACFILYLDLKTGLIVILALGTIVGLIQYLIRREIVDLGRRTDEANSGRFVQCLQALQSIKEIKTTQKEAFFCGLFEAPAQNYAKSFTRVQVLQILPSYMVQAMAAAFVIGLALYYLRIGRPLPAILPLVSVYAVAGYRLMPSLNRLSTSISQMRQQRSVFDNVIQILATLGSDEVGSTAQPTTGRSPERLQFTDKIGIKDLSFSYPNSKDRKNVLNRLNFEIRSNTFVAIAGGSGAGKTTLVDVLLGLFAPKEGEILVDGRRLTSADLSRWRSMIGYIPQSIYLLDGTIADNIAFGQEKSKIDLEQVLRVARMAHLDDIVNQAPAGLDSRIGERGINLSGGQRQRLAIARALYPDPTILIMDEPTSALDGITEQGIVRTLTELKQEKTIILIAHRNSTIRSSDRILLLDQGKLVDSGSYDDLIKRNRHFADLMSHQQPVS